MAGVYLSGERKTRPGTFYRIERSGFTTESATNGILACLFQSNWGPLNKEFDVDQTMMNNLEDYFGDGATILREGLIGGAITIRAVRVGGDDGECSKVILKNVPLMGTASDSAEAAVGTSDVTLDLNSGAQPASVVVKVGDNALTLDTDYAVSTNDGEVNVTVYGKQDGVGDVTITYTKTIELDPADGVEVSAKYPGAREFTASIRTNLITDKRQLLIYDGTEIFASVSFDAGGDEAQALVDALATNRHFTARKLAVGVLADVTQAAMTGGTNPTVTTASYSKGTEILERFRWNCVVADSDDSAVNGILTAFVAQSYETGRLGFTCIAGKSSQEYDARTSYAASCNDSKVVYVLNGWIANDGTVYDGWRAAARIGGMIAACESNVSLTHDVITNALELIEPLTNGEIIRAEQKGCLVLTLNAEDQIQIDNAITTLVTLDANQDEGWKKIRRGKTRFELIDRVVTAWDKLIGNIDNSVNGRATLVAIGQRVINEMVGENKLVTGSYVEEDPAHPAEGDSAFFKFHVLDLDSVEKIYSTFVFQYGQSFSEE